jgi:hypothetical protein
MYGICKVELTAVRIWQDKSYIIQVNKIVSKFKDKWVLQKYMRWEAQI